MGVTSLALFGSAARNESSSESDVDLLVEFDEPVGLFHFFSVQHRLEEILGVRKVDLVQRGALHPALRDRILAEAVHVA
jgi:predicted nucleotidyltransferase